MFGDFEERYHAEMRVTIEQVADRIELTLIFCLRVRPTLLLLTVFMRDLFISEFGPKPRAARLGEASMPSMRYIQISSHEPIKAIDVSTQIHFLLTPGEARGPDTPFTDLTVGGVDISGEDEKYNVRLLSSKRVATVAKALQAQSWESLDKVAKAGQDIYPPGSWHVGLRPDFESLRDFFSDASEKGYAVLGISSKR